VVTGHPIESVEQLIAYFAEGAKPRARWRIGTEHEKILVSARDGSALPVSGQRGVMALLRRMAERFAYRPIEDHGALIGLEGPHARITVEPGGQVELSGEQCESIHCTQREFALHARQLTEVAREFDALVLGLGMHPFSSVEQIELLPKQRYRIMYPYMQRKGRLGVRMMKQTAAVQANIDYGDEADAMRKLRLSFGLAPLFYALFANSPLSDGGLNGYQSFRGHVWTDTDPDRCGMPEFVFRDDAGFEDYARYALGVPLYFIARDDNYVDLTRPPGITFGRFLAEGFEGERPTLADWALHLSTIFTEGRLRQYVEVRSADSQPPFLMPAVPALVKGVFYDADCMAAGWDLVKRWSYAERLELLDAAHKHGLSARAGRVPLRDLALELVSIAIAGLEGQALVDEHGQDESIYLARLYDQARAGQNQATLAIEQWKGRWNYEAQRLIRGCAYDSEALAA
jgi:glutamate--cysteine ligase